VVKGRRQERIAHMTSKIVIKITGRKTLYGQSPKPVNLVKERRLDIPGRKEMYQVKPDHIDTRCLLI
jgi:hypothetical protein